MIRQRLGRFVTVITTAAVAMMVLGVGAVSAAPPRWTMTVDKLPGVVSPGADAGYRVTVTNLGPSNISQLFLTSDQTAQPSYISAPSQGSCAPTGRLFCSFGALVAGASVVVTVAYETPTTGNAFGVVFQANSNGATFSDTKKRSHGDTLEPDPRVTSTVLNASPHFAGGFAVDATTYANDQDVKRQNPQATTITGFSSLVPVTIEDGITSGVPCTIAACANTYGQWSKLNVNDGATFAQPFKVTLLIWGGAVPSGVGVDDVVILHTTDEGTTYVIDTQCDPATGTPTNAECINVSKVGNNFRIEVWLLRNGSIRGGI